MADLTPPSSKQNTPLRPVEPSTDTLDVPASPTSQRASTEPRAAHPLMTTASDMDVDPKEFEDTSTEEDEENSEDEVVDVPQDGEEVKQADVEGEQKSDGNSDRVTVKERRKTVGKGSRIPTESAAKSRKRKTKGRSGIEGTGGARRMKDGELYESDIVARWNQEFGDVCLEPATTGPAGPSVKA